MSAGLNRREFLERSARAVAASGLLGGSVCVGRPEQPTTGAAAKLIWKNKQPTMAYRRLGRTNFMTSRVVFGAGGLYARRAPLRLLELAIERGVNYIDTGRPYGGSERAIAPVVKKHRDRLWITSKAGHIGWPDMRIRPGQDAEAARLYSRQLDESLRALGTDHVDCYMIQGVQDEWVVRMDSLYGAFERARKAGKVGYFGLATHTNVKRVCLAAARSGRYDVVMLSLTPASLAELSGAIRELRRADVGVVSMKTAGQIRLTPRMFDGVYGDMFAGRRLSAYQRAYAYLLFRGGVDAFNSHMPSVAVLEENLAVPLLRLSKAELDRLGRAAVAEARGACRHCGSCAVVCPAGIDPAGALRSHAYVHRYRCGEGEEGLSRAALSKRVRLCRDCGACRAACPEGIDLPAAVRLLRERIG